MSSQVNQLYQHSVVSAFMQGTAGRGPEIGQVLAQNDYGIGAGANINGEIVVVDGEAYHFSPDGAMRRLPPTETVSYIMATKFKPTFTTKISHLQLPGLWDALDPLLPSRQNWFISVHVEAMLDYVKFRVIPARSSPGETILELARRQETREWFGLKGVIFGFWSPLFTSSFTAPGFHLHLLSDDRQVGGHVMDFHASSASISAAEIHDYRVHLPSDPEFHTKPLCCTDAAEVNAVNGTESLMRLQVILSEYLGQLANDISLQTVSTDAY